MWLTIPQVVELGITEQWVRRKIASGEYQSRESGARGRNGKAIREVLLMSLPSELQWRWRSRQGGPSAVVEAENSTRGTEVEGGCYTTKLLRNF